MKEKNIKLFITPIIAIVVFATILFAAGYAYFTSNIIMNSANYQINLPKQTSLICTKTDCSVNITPAMMLNTNTNATTSKSTSTCYTNCTCSGTPGSICNYNLTLVETGNPYFPSSGLGSNKEFTVKVTSPAGCTAQNTSGTETQINNMKDKLVSKCSLTVPDSGSISANVSAQFKWYNQNIDQTMHAYQLYEYDFSTADRFVIFREGSESTFIGSSIVPRNGWCLSGNLNGSPANSCTDYYLAFDSQSECQDMMNYLEVSGTCSLGSTTGFTNYVTNRNDISGTDYLKHIVEDNKIVDTFLCLKYTLNGNLKEVCVKGGDSSYYGTFGEINTYSVSSPNIPTNPTGNIRRFVSSQREIETAGGDCYYNSTSSRCSIDGTMLISQSNGVAASLEDGYLCSIQIPGVGMCGILFD